MKQVVFSKFSNERADAFKIRTDILKDEAGNLSVRKIANVEAAKVHIAQIAHWYEALSEGYAKADMKANRCKLATDGSYVDLEYLTGRTLQDVLDELYYQGEYDKLIAQIVEFATRVKETGKQEPFERTEAFERVFGVPDFTDKKYGAQLNNIDLIFPNIILNDGWNIIDYEWTFDFQVPVDFIIYRAVYYCFLSKNGSEKLKQKIYETLGITSLDRELYQEMEHCFQLYILSGTFGANNLYPLIAGFNYELEQTIEAEKEYIDKKKIQIYYDFGEAYSEKNSIWVAPLQGTDNVYEFPIMSNMVNLRVDPCDYPGVLKFKLGYVLGHRELPLTCKTNGELMTDSNFVFDTEDPYLEFFGFEGVQGTFHIELEYAPVEKEFVQTIYPLIEHRKERERLQVIYDDVAEKYKESLRVSDEYRMLTSSVFWKVTKPQRVCIDGIKRFFHHHYWMIGGMRNLKRFIKCKGLEGMRQMNAQEWKIRKNLHVLNEISLVYDLRDMDKQNEQAKQTSQDIKFSILVPLYNTPELYLRKMIESVLSQTYENFELCLADGSDRKHRYVGDICKEYRWHDKRVVYKKLKKNLGISENTNACLEMATGDYIALFDHDDMLHPSALYRNYEAISNQGADFIYSDENTFHETIDDAYSPHYKPDFNPDYLRSVNYICHLTVFSRKLYEQVGGFRKEFDGSQDYDIILRLTEKATKIVHIPQVLYYWRAHEESTAKDIHAKDYCMVAAKKALAEHLDRIGIAGTVEDASILSWYRIRYALKGQPKVSIIIPNKDHIDLLKRCVDSIQKVSTYENYEIIIVENNSELRPTFKYYESLKANKKVKVVYWKDEFNYSAINNYGATFADGDYVLLLNNDMEIITPDWLQEMLMFAQRDDVGAVGAKLYYSNDTVQHGGVILGIGGVAGHSHKYFDKNNPGYFGRLVVAQDLSAVTAACMMMPKAVFEQVGGLDEGYKVAFNDVDLCMKIREAGYLIVYTPYAELYHYESLSRGSEDTPEKVERFNGEVRLFMDKWQKKLDEGDPYYNPNLTLVYEDFREK